MPTISSRTAVAVHVLALLTRSRGEPLASERIAGSVNTNPVVVRRIVGALREAGLVEVQAGARGGALLARPPERITLRDVYDAVERDDDLFSLHPRPPCGHCDVGAHIQAVLASAFGAAQAAMEEVLAQVTVADVFHRVCGAADASACPEERTAGATGT